MAKTHDHEVVSIYPFSEEQVEALVGNAIEAVLMWATKDGWPVGVTHAFIWRDGKIWLTFSSHRHRAAAIRRDNPNIAKIAVTNLLSPIFPFRLPIFARQSVANGKPPSRWRPGHGKLPKRWWQVATHATRGIDDSSSNDTDC